MANASFTTRARKIYIYTFMKYSNVKNCYKSIDANVAIVIVVNWGMKKTTTEFSIAVETFSVHQDRYSLKEKEYLVYLGMNYSFFYVPVLLHVC